MCTILFDNLHPLAEEDFEKCGYPSSKNTRVVIERELEEEQYMIDQLYEEFQSQIYDYDASQGEKHYFT
ncbi:hypothetical protein Ga0466249_001549 [Sporomusaceae bacterium BoRhaA]|uniref:hypothetical protein n=1 Tax=Pelorhabdus rhamnosifermentans TaxID=2772457 RepID=UPI001C062F36|nr:hypothetical protein [Pelorhabdus rhamnosifermentans]MBU2700457.1 hypothetical protein [Pelorhabdus rhamnosifermentans]